MSISIGDKVLMQYSTLGDKWLCVVTEVRENESLTVCSHLSEKIVQHLKRHNTALIRFVSEGRLWGYKTRVLGDFAVGDELVRLAYPKDAVSMENRSEPRCQCCFPAMLDIGGELYEAHVADMSHSAFRIRLQDASVAFNGSMEGIDAQLEFFIFEPANAYKVRCRLLKTFMKDHEKFAVLEIQDGEDIKNKIACYVEGLCRGGFLSRF
ncbi:PilZ domain-containing protein [Salidesulfovibrio onnuriiensis]|uniref:PilZ domain-containing protein n=1 Tax=Salidesulfovibrio onnuriiensis TaxID=2583823 RepID=UPI0011CC52AA|nr:PilZ domain-containing protein [Salidesulfovibrio onnuriiensis]